MGWRQRGQQQGRQQQGRQQQEQQQQQPQPQPPPRPSGMLHITKWCQTLAFLWNLSRNWAISKSSSGHWSEIFDSSVVVGARLHTHQIVPAVGSGSTSMVPLGLFLDQSYSNNPVVFLHQTTSTQLGMIGNALDDTTQSNNTLSGPAEWHLLWLSGGVLTSSFCNCSVNCLKPPGLEMMGGQFGCP